MVEIPAPGPAAMWNARYSEEGFAYGSAPNDFLVERTADLLGPVLSLAEGEGRNGVWLATRGLEVTAVDLSPVGLEKAEALAASHGVHLHTVVADLATYDVAPGAWGSIVAIWCHLPPVERARLFAACVKGLRPGGAMLIESYTPDQIALGTGGPRDRALCMTLAALRDELRGLELVVGREVRRDVHEGRYHEGPSATVQVLGRKPG